MAKSMRTAFVRVHLINNTESGPVVYSLAELGNMFQEVADTYAGCEFAYILHDKDKTPDGEKKADHVHCVFRFKNPVPFDNIKKKIPYGQIQSARSVNAAVQYLCHKNNPEKYQYSFTDIHGNFDESTLEDLFVSVDNEGKKTDKLLKTIIDRIMAGEIKEYNRFNYIDDYTLIKYNKQINLAFKMRGEKRMRNNERSIKVYFLEGDAGSGKTTMAKQIAAQVGDGSYYVSGSKNDSIEGYKGENTLILDDLRDDAFEWDDLLKILDNNTGTYMKSRYFNKCFLGDLIIITTNKPLSHWYDYVRENKAAFRRRISVYYKMNADKIDIYIPDPDNAYNLAYKCTLKNPTQKTREMEKAVREKDLDMALNLLSLMSSDLSSDIQEIKKSLTDKEKDAFRDAMTALGPDEYPAKLFKKID